MEKLKILKTLVDIFPHYPGIPPDICKYVENVVISDAQERLFPALSGQWREKTLERIECLFKEAKRILQCDNKKIIKGLDFHPNDIGRGRIDAMFAELRIVVWLDLNGFRDIQLMAAKKNKQADMLAFLSDSKYAVEVFCSSACAYRWPDHRNNRLDLFKDFLSEANEKRIQLDATAEQFGCDKKLLVLVLDSYPAVTLLERNDYLALLKRVAKTLEWGQGYHFALVTGQKSLREGPDDIVFPPF